MFADDTTLVSDSKDGLQELLRVFGYACKRRKLKVNLIKNKVMRICGNSEEC